MNEHEQDMAIIVRDQMGRFLSGGTRKRYETAEAIQQEIIKYFETCEQEKKRPTMTGLALSLGFQTRDALHKYRCQPGYEFAWEAIAFAKLKIEEYYEQALTDPKTANVAGVIFTLKNNFNWADRQEIKLDQRTIQLEGFKMKTINIDDSNDQPQ